MEKLYSVLRPIKKVFLRLDRFGLVKGVKINFAFLKNKGIIEVKIPKVNHPIKIRGGTSDINVFEEVFLLEDYNINVDVKPKLIIDGGANVGYASIFFANKYPDAEIIAVEPEESNFRLLKENVSFYPNVKLVKAGIHDKNTYLKISNLEKDQKWGFQVEESNADDKDAFKSITINDILKDSKRDMIDILKLDIEGSEKEVFEDCEDWLGKVKVLIIELHEVFKPGCEEVFYSKIKDYDFRKFQRGENIVLVRNIQKEL